MTFASRLPSFVFRPSCVQNIKFVSSRAGPVREAAHVPADGGAAPLLRGPGRHGAHGRDPQVVALVRPRPLLTPHPSYFSCLLRSASCAAFTFPTPFTRIGLAVAVAAAAVALLLMCS